MNRISQKDIIKAIQQIKLTPELRKGRASSTYDLIFEGIAYPPKLVISIANEYATGKELDPSDFEGGVGTPAFKLLKKEGFKIIAKEQHIIEAKENNEFIKLIEKFIIQSKTNNLKTTIYNKQFRDLKVKVSFGQGRSARIPWVGLLKEPNTISKGIYPVFLLFKELNVLVLAYGKSETNKPEFKWSNIDFSNTINDWHSGEYGKSPDRYGSSYIKRIYDLDLDLDKEMIKQDLNEIVFEYQKLDFETKLAPDYWVFQGSPKIYNMVDALKSNSIKTWTVSSHRKKIKIGDKFILWSTGKHSGCYALGRVTSSVTVMKEEDVEMGFYLKPHSSILNHRVSVEIEHNYFNDPILKEKITNNDIFKGFKGGSQGTNFSATKEEYDTMIKLKNKHVTIQYWLYSPGEDANHWDEFYNFRYNGFRLG